MLINNRLNNQLQTINTTQLNLFLKQSHAANTPCFNKIKGAIEDVQDHGRIF